MMDKVKEYLLWLWDWSKRIFGRSKIIFLQVVGLVATGWVELADPLAMFDWDSVVDQHSTAILIQVVVQVLTLLLRTFASNAPASFQSLDNTPKVVVVPSVPEVSEVEETPSPKAG